MAIKKLEHVGIMVKDMATSINFYTEVLGLELKDQFKHLDPSITLAFLGFENQPDVVIELVEGYSGKLENEGKVHHIAFTVEDIEGEIERLKTFDVNFTDDEITTLPNGSRYIFFEGPDQESIELFQPAK